MNANAVPLLSIFEPKLRLEVPLFQRQYVWNQDQQWAPLWEDIARKFTEYLEGRADAPVHFLGAMVLDQKLTPTTHVARRQVIDGQQRLTTLQLFLATFRDFCADQGCLDLAQECRSYTFNSGMMANPAIDKFKVWPTKQDQSVFLDVMAAESRTEVERKYPLVRRRYARAPEPRPRMVDAYLFFYQQLTEYFLGDGESLPIAASSALPTRLEQCFTALRSALQVVVIDLGEKDDPQVIFETLNARGEPLLPADLLRNYIFLRAGRLGESQEELYQAYWIGFDDDFWRQVVRQGRLNRPRSDLFMQHFLASQLNRDISAKHLYVEYKHWIETRQPFATIKDELATLQSQRLAFRRIIAPEEGDPLAPLATFLEVFEVSTAFPLLLTILESGIADDDLTAMAGVIESYLLRRAVCGMTTKNYNRIFLGLSRTLRESEVSLEGVRQHMLSLRGESSLWPTDTEFRHAWLTSQLYRQMSPARVTLLLRRLSDSYLSNWTEAITISSPLTVEHILPQSWVEHWPLPSGERGLALEEMDHDDPDTEHATASRRRHDLVQTVGNLTLLTQPLNSSASNSAWPGKRSAMQMHSLLPINLPLRQAATWDEDAIVERGQSLFERALKIWPGPAGRSASV